MSKKIQKIVSVTTSVATIAWLSGVGMLAPMAALAVTINEGDTIKTAANPDVYIAKYVGANKYKRLILNPDVFNSYKHLSWGAIKTVTQAELDVFTTSDLVRAQGDTKVFKLIPNGDVGDKEWVNMTAEAFTANGWDWNSIYVINNVDRDNYTAASDITGGTPAAPVKTAAATPVATGAVSVALASDTPVAGVTAENAARVPFTKVSFTAGSSDVTITALKVQRTGLMDDAAISSLSLIDNQTNLQVGLSQTLNALHQVTFTESLTISANTTKYYTLSANMPADDNNYQGQTGALSLVAVTTTATVSGVLPITGNSQAINSNLVIGTATVAAGSLDPGTTATKEVGTTGYNFAGIKITAGSTESITVYSIKWNQAGSAASSDLANIVISDGTTNYATTISSDGKYYTASFGTGLVLAKGLNKEFTIKGDIKDGSARTVDFNLYKRVDISVKGDTYGYYLTPTSAGTGVFSNSDYPFFNAYAATIGAGSLRVDKSALLAPAANITTGATGQTLGAFDFVVQGESVNVASTVVNFIFTGTGTSSNLTNITLYKVDGTVLAGPVNPSSGIVTFSTTITYPVGTTQILVKGDLSTTFVAEDTIVVGFDTPAAKITSATGVTTGTTITATPASNVRGNTMTVKAGSMSVTVSGVPVAQTVIRGTTGYTLARLLFDASGSGENIRVTTLQLTQTVDALANAIAVASVQLYDDTTALNTGSNVLNPTNNSTYCSGTTCDWTISLDNNLVVTKGTTKTVTVKANMSATATDQGTQSWGLKASPTVTATGVSTGSTITASGISAAQTGQIMTIATGGQYSVKLDAGTPQAQLLVANTTGNVMTKLRFYATSEQINVSKVKLGLTTATSSGSDLGTIYLYDGATLLGSGVFPSLRGSPIVKDCVAFTGCFTDGQMVAKTASTTFVLTTPLSIPANTEKVVTIKADIAVIQTSATIANAGHDVRIDYINTSNISDNTTYNVGTGAASGAQIGGFMTTGASATTTAQTAAFIFKSVPTVSKLAVATILADGSSVPIYKFRVAADAKGDIDLYKVTFRISTSSGTAGIKLITALNLVDVTAGQAETTVYASTCDDTQNAGLPAATTDLEMELRASPGTWAAALGGITPRTIAAGSYRDFELRATVAGAVTGTSITTQLQGDANSALLGAEASWPAGTMASRLQPALSIDNINKGAGAVNGDEDFIWSDWSAASHTRLTSDWANGYLVSGLPSSNLTAEVVSK